MNKMAASKRTLSERLAEFVHGARFEDFPKAAVDRAKGLIIYHATLAFTGLDLEHGRQAIAVAKRMSGAGPSSIIGQRFKAAPIDAAFANCTLMRAQGLDDVIFPAGIHAGLLTLPVALALGEANRRSGRDVLAAIIVGYEMLGKFGTWTWSAATPRRPTMPFGAFGSISVAARLLGLSLEQCEHAMGYAAHMAMGLAESDLGPITHYYSLVCRNGIMGAILAEEGGVSSRTVLEGKFGFIDSFLGEAPAGADALIASLGHDPAIFTSTEKRYPGTALNVVPIEAMRDLVANHGVNARNVKHVHIKLPKERFNFDAGHSTGPFESRGPASSSVAFQIAIMLLDGTLKIERYDQFANPEIMAQVAKMSVEAVSGRKIRYACVEVTLNDGRVLTREGDDHVFADEDRRAVMIKSAGHVMSVARIDRFLDLVGRMDSLKEIGEVMACLVPEA